MGATLLAGAGAAEVDEYGVDVMALDSVDDDVVMKEEEEEGETAPSW